MTWASSAKHVPLLVKTLQLSLKRYGVDATEADMISSFDVAGLLRAGVSPLLTYGFWMMNAPVKTRAAYLERSREAA